MTNKQENIQNIQETYSTESVKETVNETPKQDYDPAAAAAERIEEAVKETTEKLHDAFDRVIDDLDTKQTEKTASKILKVAVYATAAMALGAAAYLLARKYGVLPTTVNTVEATVGLATNVAESTATVDNPVA